MTIELLENLTEALEVLYRDVLTARDLALKDPTNQTLLRGIVRAFCAYVEAQTFYLKQVVGLARKIVGDVLKSDRRELRKLLGETFSIDLFPLDSSLLHEKSVDVQENGVLRFGEKFVPTLANIRFAHRLYTSTIKSGYTIDYTGRGWFALTQIFKLRNRLTHPKSVGDLLVSDDATVQLADADNWFRREVLAMQAAATEKMRVFAQAIGE